MLMNRIMGALTFRKEVYSEVEGDEGFTNTAWLLVAAVAFLGQLGSSANLLREAGFVQWLIAAIVGTLVAVIGFGLAMYVVAWVGKAVFNAEVTFNEMVRTLGLAYVWNIIGLLSILGAFGLALSCLVSLPVLIGRILGFVASLIAAKEALDLEWLQTIVTIVIGWIVIFVFFLVSSIVLTALGLTVAGVAGALN